MVGTAFHMMQALGAAAALLALGGFAAPARAQTAAELERLVPAEEIRQLLEGGYECADYDSSGQNCMGYSEVRFTGPKTAQAKQIVKIGTGQTGDVVLVLSLSMTIEDKLFCVNAEEIGYDVDNAPPNLPKEQIIQTIKAELSSNGRRLCSGYERADGDSFISLTFADGMRRAQMPETLVRFVREKPTLRSLAP